MRRDIDLRPLLNQERQSPHGLIFRSFGNLFRFRLYADFLDNFKGDSSAQLNLLTLN
jgi:hypothetical protein